ncbi:sodium-dependent phosphate transporter [Anaeramoeba ignava]|uniref:Phosphate transporter n=1 Tax=Anaeramoeba ignava TaxID=1746090 RepID=A0A9Q0R5P9_ANAIG|nr:sodium-dependent phosphate transporter [Anaeramoeba ignava]
MGVLLFFLIFGAICCFLMAFGIGMNNAANSVGTAVGSKAISAKKALLIGSFFEFCGAVLIGSFVSQTIRKGIITTTDFIGNEKEFSLGMLSSLLGSTLWLVLATYWALPVSTTHSIVGGILGFAMYVYGPKVVNTKSLINIVLSWVISPVSGFVVSWAMYTLVKKTILNKKTNEQSFKAAKLWTPIHFGFTISTMVLFFLESGSKWFNFKFAIWIMVLIFFLSWILAWFICYKWILKIYLRKALKPKEFDIDVDAHKMNHQIGVFDSFGIIDLNLEEYQDHGFIKDERAAEEFKFIIEPEKLTEIPVDDKNWKILTEDEFITEFSESIPDKEAEIKLEEFELQELKTDEDQNTDQNENNKDNNKDNKKEVRFENQTESNIDDDDDFDSNDELNLMKQIERKRKQKQIKEGKDPNEPVISPYKAEIEKLGGTVPLFMLLQVITAMFVAFGHGGNDTPNATAPFGSIYSVYTSGDVTKVQVSFWVLAIGGFALALGLLIFGHRVLITVGEKITLLTPTGGYISQLSTALTTVVCSRLGMPISTTHILIGAVLGYGVSLYGWSTGINGKMIFKIVVSWLVTLPISSITAIMIFAVLRPLCGNFSLN